MAKINYLNHYPQNWHLRMSGRGGSIHLPKPHVAIHRPAGVGAGKVRLGGTGGGRRWFGKGGRFAGLFGR